MIPAVAGAPNDLWTADFNGQFRTGDHAYCYPLTVADLASRFLLTWRIDATGLPTSKSSGFA